MLSHFSSVRLCVTPYSSLPGSPVHGIFQARVLEWVASTGVTNVEWITFLYIVYTH